MKDRLAAYFIDQAEWRDRKAEEYPDDHRNAQSAAGLRELAAYVAMLPDDDERLRMLAALDPLEGDNLVPFMPGEEAGRMASRFRFRDVGDDVDGFFTSWAETYSREWAEQHEEEPDGG
jgi:hypothetical protein